VLFRGRFGLTTSTQGIFISSDGLTSPVLRTGDLLFGQVVIGVFVNPHSLDPAGNGNIAFTYQLANGVTGVALATPVPEPSALALAATALALIIRRRRAR
jgi:hypothetical protein